MANIATREETRLLDALREWQQYAYELSTVVLLLPGGHPIGKHQLPDDYDSESGLACVSPDCVSRMLGTLPPE